MGCNDILTGMQQRFQLAVQVQLHALYPSLAGVGHLGAVDIQLKDIVMAIDDIQVFLQVAGLQVDGTAHVEVTVQVAPMCVDEAQSVTAPCSLAALPSVSLEVGLLPAALLHLTGVVGLPCFLVGHRGYGLQHGTLGTHPPVHLTIYTQQSLQGFLIISPVASGAIGQLVVGRPDAEIRVTDYQRH